MRHTKKMLLAVLVAVVGLLGTSTPASAAVVGEVKFVVEVRISPGLGVVGAFPATNGSISIVAPNIACAGEVAGKSVAEGQCAISGSGGITGNCGLSSGTVWGGITVQDIVTGGTVSGTFHINFQTAGGAVVATGTVTVNGQTGTVTVEGNAAPTVTVGGPSCATGNQTDFIVVGEAKFAAT